MIYSDVVKLLRVSRNIVSSFLDVKKITLSSIAERVLVLTSVFDISPEANPLRY